MFIHGKTTSQTIDIGNDSIQQKFASRFVEKVLLQVYEETAKAPIPTPNNLDRFTLDQLRNLFI